jgi:hypothetical protein
VEAPEEGSQPLEDPEEEEFVQLQFRKVDSGDAYCTAFSRAPLDPKRAASRYTKSNPRLGVRLEWLRNDLRQSGSLQSSEDVYMKQEWIFGRIHALIERNEKSDDKIALRGLELLGKGLGLFQPVTHVHTTINAFVAAETDADKLRVGRAALIRLGLRDDQLRLADAPEIIDVDEVVNG